MIKEFREIWDRDESDDKANAQKELGYIFFMISPKSIFFNSSDKQADISRELFGVDDYQPDELILKAMEKYEKMISTPTLRMLQSGMMMADKTTEYFRDLDNMDIDLADIEKIQKILTSMSKSSASLEEMYAKVQAGQAENDEKIYGEQTFSLLDE